MGWGCSSYVIFLTLEHFIITPASTELKRGYTGFTSSICPSVRPSICGWNRIRSVSSTILAGSSSYLYLLSSSFRRCVTCEVSWDPIWINSMGDHGAAGVFSECRRSSCSSCIGATLEIFVILALHLLSVYLIDSTYAHVKCGSRPASGRELNVPQKIVNIIPPVQCT